MRKVILTPYLFLISFFCFIAISISAKEEPLKKATFIPQWAPQAQFVGYYVAYEKGIYKKHGVDLTIIPGGPEASPSELLNSHQADFATLWLSSGIQMRDAGIGLVNIAQILQRSALMLVAKKTSGIETLQDINGRKVGLWGPIFQIQPKALFKKYDIHVKIISQSYSVNLFLRDGVDVASAMWYNEYHTILNAGINPEELTTFFFYEYGLNFPEDGIYTLQETYEKDPELCCAFVKASIEGWQYAFVHPEEALDVVMKYMEEAHIPANRIHQKWMLERMKDLILPEDTSIAMGRLLFDDYERVAQGLKENKLIDEIPGFETFYKRCDNHAKE